MKTEVKFIHTSDWQLGMTRHFLSVEAAARFSQARIDAITTLGSLASSHKAKFIIVSGDVFESNQISRETLARTIDALKKLPVPVFLLPGNHDPLDGSSIFATSEFEKASENIIVLKDFDPVQVPGVPDIEVVGAPWKSKRPTSDLCADLADSLERADGVVRIAVAHGQIDTLSPDKNKPELIQLTDAEKALDDGKFHYLGLGDRHSVKSIGDTGKIWYSGAPVATDFVEDDPNKALLVDAHDDGTCSVEPLSVGSWKFVRQIFPMNSAEDLVLFRNWLDSLETPELAILKIGFEGSVSLKVAAELDELLERDAVRFASLKLWKRKTDLVKVPDELDEDSVSLSGYAKATWVELLEATKAGDDEAQDALTLLFRLSDRMT
ncbi:MAG: exonuclease SbcCD subunit D [Gammaproteobacteria bacterium]